MARRWLRWEGGRQGGGYRKLLLAESKWLRFDCYLLAYPSSAAIGPHRDPALPGFEHHRINIVVRRPDAGGEFICPGAFINTARVKYFRPDIQEHSVAAVSGERWVLSIGWLRRAREAATQAQ